MIWLVCDSQVQTMSKHWPPLHWRWDQLPMKSKHFLPTGRTRGVLIVKIMKTRSQSGVLLMV